MRRLGVRRAGSEVEEAGRGRTRIGARVACVVAMGGLAACGQVLGLGGYGPELDAATVSVEGGVDLDSSGTDATVAEAEAPREQGDSPAEATIDPPALRDAATGTSKAPDAASSDAAAVRHVDASGPAPADHSEPDGRAVDGGIEANTDSPGGCPTQCNGGCPHGTCTIAVTSSSAGIIDCPAGLPCEVQCRAKECGGVVNCPAGQQCNVVCSDNHGCDSCWIACFGPGCAGTCGN